ncbi:MAG TPA: MlaD family protein [Solirubrobacteraceae bacterium]|jgi:phospholipid/cholesterol/gamma-HCH transport system substrate-binding protein|nr:MlaD family protein [Solirubrobacteraceae bacterium]
MRNSSVIGRVAAVAAVAVALVAVAIIVLSSGSSYQVRAVFANASQIVSGDLVEVSGTSIGTVSNIALTSGGQAQLTLNITNHAYNPLHQGTQATIRELSLSGIASRYVDLTPGSAAKPTIHADGVIPTADTTSEVDLDEIFNTLNGPTLKGLQDVFQGSASQVKGAGQKMQAAFQYLNPAVAASSALFSELNRNTGNFTNFITKTGKLVSDVATRSSDLSGLVSHLSTTTQALANQRVALGQSLQRLPGFMRLANTTFVNLRSALDDLKPLVDASKPVAPKLEKLLVQLRPLARNSVPTLNDLSDIIHRPGADNDLIELTKLGVPLSAATVKDISADGKVRPGAFPESSTALNDSTPELATARPYAVDLTGWFEGYTHPGTIDANGGSSRIAPVIGIGSVENGALNLLPSFTNPTLRSILAFGGLGNVTGTGSNNPTNSQGVLVTGQGDRCPGSMERGGLYYPETGFPCDPSEVPTGK